MTVLLITTKVLPGREAEFEAVAAEMQAAVRATEPGAIFYGFYRTAEPFSYVIVEHYQDAEAFDVHRATEHFQRLRPRLAELWDGPPEVSRLTAIG